MNSAGIIGKGLRLVKAIIFPKLEGRGEFLGGENDKFNFKKYLLIAKWDEPWCKVQ